MAPLALGARRAVVAALLLHLSLCRSLARRPPSPPSAPPRTPAAARQQQQPQQPASGGALNASLVLLSNNPLGAKCLDGSPPGYYFRPGFGAGKRFWHIFLPAGGWCATLADCALRATHPLGSTRYWARLNGSAPSSTSAPPAPSPPSTSPSRPLPLFPAPSSPTSSFDDSDDSQSASPLRAVPGFSGMLSGSEAVNPGLFNWNLAMPIYCDGGGYAGTAGRVQLPGKGNNSIYLDGYNVTRAILADLLAVRGMASARRVLVAGASAGGQAVTAWCERVAGMVPGAATKCLMDSGIFLDARDRAGVLYFRQVARQMTALHRAHGNDKCMQGAQRLGLRQAVPEQHTAQHSQPHTHHALQHPAQRHGGEGEDVHARRDQGCARGRQHSTRKCDGDSARPGNMGRVHPSFSSTLLHLLPILQ
ncbi:hypothetical protein CLOM_g19739 [Closterium sp. NIES-68]|nr:hypothetical protein CLOM_g19739 [Closterium sp. NIES-68]GJP84526.1 hypothetical protein CLOP_g14587 [Closterium sp. NIES-67]